jgi:hypothetical protein
MIHGEWEIITGDPRFVMLVLPLVDSLADWQRGILGGSDFWARAENFIAKRMSGEVGCDSHILLQEMPPRIHSA